MAKTISMRKPRRLRSSALCAIALLVAACGGGGSNPPPAAPAQNRAPTILIPTRSERVIADRPIQLDPVDPPIFSDPDGDPLTITVAWEAQGDTPGTWNGLRIVGDRIEGIAAEPGTNPLSITANDGRGGLSTYRMELVVAANQAPILRTPGPDRLVGVGEPILFDATESRFEDPDGDPLTYSVTFAPASRGLQAVGTTVTGQLSAIGAVRVIVSASDGFGGTQSDMLMVAAPAAEPGRPQLPATSYIYDDSLLDWPEIFRPTRQNPTPFHDTTPPDNRTTNAGATLGRVLFYDKRLSITNTHSCGSCHEQQRGFAAATRFSAGATGELSRRNSMALANVRYNLQNRYFGDLRAAGLEELALMPIEDPIELGNTLPAAIAKLSATDFYPPLFATAFGSGEITADRIARAIAQFLRAIVSYRSRFDRAYHYVSPPEAADPSTVLTPLELRGELIFVSELCRICHTTGPHSSDNAFNNGLDEQFTDAGAGDGRFRSASLRNIAVTGPYMHDGRFATLREVIDHYDSGVQASPQVSSVLLDLGASPQIPRRLNLSEYQKQALEAFLNTLTDDELLNDPKFSDPFS